MKLTFSNAKLSTEEKDMGDCTVYPVYGHATVTSDEDIRAMIYPTTVKGFYLPSMGTHLSSALAKSLPTQRLPAASLISKVSEDGKSFFVSWKHGYGHSDEGERSVTIEPSV